jgi:hypothetical protein
MKRELTKKLIEWGLKLKSKKQRRQVVYITCQEREGKKNQTITGDNSTIVSCHTPLQIEEDTAEG